MEIRKLFQVLVLGGAALTAAHCGGADGSETNTPPPTTQPPPSVQSSPDSGSALPDGGIPDGGENPNPGGGPRSW